MQYLLVSATTISSHPQNAFHHRNQCHHLYLTPPAPPGRGAAAGGRPPSARQQGGPDSPEPPEVGAEDPEHGRGQLLPPRPRGHQGVRAPAAEAGPVQVQVFSLESSSDLAPEVQRRGLGAEAAEHQPGVGDGVRDEAAPGAGQTSERRPGPGGQVRVCPDEGGPAHARGQLHEGRHELPAPVRLRHLGARLRGGTDRE